MDFPTADMPGTPSFAFSATLLWMITIYGVAFLLSAFVSLVHVRERTATGARLLRWLALVDAALAPLAPGLGAFLGALGIGLAVGASWLVMAALVFAMSRLPLEEAGGGLPPARIVGARRS